MQTCRRSKRLFGLYVISILSLSFLVNCRPTEKIEATPFLQSTQEEIRLPSATPSFTSTPVPPSATPTPRYFTTEISCTLTDDFGHILYLKQRPENKRTRLTRFDLYIMQGNGCFPRLVMEEVSNAPAWSGDGKMIAVGCENNSHVCILDAEKTLETCPKTSSETNACTPSILNKFLMPENIAGENNMYNISFSPTMKQLVVEGKKGECCVSGLHLVYILSLGGDGKWEKILERDFAYHAAWSPTESQLALSGIRLLNPNNSEEFEKIVPGSSPEWSPDGKQIIFLKASDSDSAQKETHGIASVDIETKEQHWLYEPVNRDNHYWPPQNLMIWPDNLFEVMSVSPNGKMIAFAAPYTHHNNSHLFTLNIDTGEITVLTAHWDGYYFSPAWGP